MALPFKKGIYETVYGNAAYVSGPKAKSAWDLDAKEAIRLSVVTHKFLRPATSKDTPQYQKYNW
jgi:hypothetical protein